MPRSTSATAAAAACCGLIAAPLFVSPGSAGQQALRGVVSSGAQAVRPQAALAEEAGSFGSATPLLGLGAVAVLAASQAKSRTGARKVVRAAFNPEKELGVQAPVRFWDPLGFCNDGNEANFKRRRAVEIKHGRVSMLACLGYIVPEYVRFPGYLSPSEGIAFSDVPNGIAALSKVPVAGWAQIFAFAGFLEVRGLAAIGGENYNPDEPGNYGLGNLGFLGVLGPIEDPEVRATKLNAEIANGRLAMFGIMGLLFQNGVTGTTGPEMYGAGESTAIIYAKVFLPALLAFAFAGETFRRGPDEKFLKYFPRSDYYGKDKRI